MLLAYNVTNTKGEKMSDNILNLIVKLKLNKAFDQEHLRMICNLSVAEYRGLIAQTNGKEMTCQEMSEVMNLSPSRSSRVIDNLVRKGYVIRKTSSYDRRSVAVRLSNKGRDVKKKIIKNQKELEQNIQNNFSDDEIDMIKNSLKMLLDYFA